MTKSIMNSIREKLNERKDEELEDSIDNESVEDDNEENFEDDEMEEDSEEYDSDDEEAMVEEETDNSAENKSSLAPKSKTFMVAQALNKMAGMEVDDLSHLLDDVLSQFGPGKNGTVDNSAENKASIAMKKTVKEDLDLLFGEDNNLSEEFKDKLTTLFDAAVQSRVNLIRTELEESISSHCKDLVAEEVDKLAQTADKYINLVAEEWLKENEISIEKSLRTDIMESFMKGLQELFVEHSIHVPEEKFDVIEELHSKVEELEESLNDLTKKNIDLKEELNVYHLSELIEDNSKDLTISQKEKLYELVESIDYDGDDEEYIKKLNILKENYFTSSKKKDTKIVTEEISHDLDSLNEVELPKVSAEMRPLYNAISKLVKKQ